MLFNQKWNDTLTRISEVKAPDLTYPSMAGLVHILRNETLWPKGFTWGRPPGTWDWNFGTELARQFWPASVTKRERGEDLTQFLAMGIAGPHDNDSVHHKIFFAREGNDVPTAEVTANRLESFMNKEAGRSKGYQALMGLRLGC